MDTSRGWSKLKTSIRTKIAEETPKQDVARPRQTPLEGELGLRDWCFRVSEDERNPEFPRPEFRSGQLDKVD